MIRRLQTASLLAVTLLFTACPDNGTDPGADASCTPKTCADLSKNCGTVSDGCGKNLECGTCTAPETCGGGGTANVCGKSACTPKTCTELGKNCGSVDNGCGTSIECGTCTVSGESCGGAGTPNVCGPGTCTPKTCADQGKNCGSVSDTCGTMLTCGTCTSPETCGGGGTANVCGKGCVAKTCTELGKNCGTIADGCGTDLNCGTCTAPATCGGAGVPNVCGAACTPKTCTELGKNCGSVDDGCGTILSCGTCTVAGEACGAGGTANVCAPGTCTAKTCVELGKNCGSVSDGCSAMLDCGLCTNGQTCGGAGTPNVCGGGTEIKTCNANLPTPANGNCDVVAGNNGKVLLTGTVLVPGTVYRGGQVLVGTDGKIACVGCDCSAQGAGATQVTCPNTVVSASLINAHDHITYANTPPPPPSAERFEHRHDWRRGKNGHTNLQSKYDISGGATNDTVLFSELRFVMSGTTATLGSGGVVGFLRNLDKDNTLQEGLGQKAADYETFPLGDSSGTTHTTDCGYSFRDPTWGAIDAYIPHIGEGIDQAALNEHICTESANNGAHDMVRSQTATIHGIAAQPANIALMAADGNKLIWSPRSNISLYGDTASVPTYHRMGVLVALGTDWLPSGSMNMLRELKCAADLNDTYFNKHFSDEQIWLMATENGARAAAMDDVIGTLKVGLYADIALFAKGTRVDHRAVIEAEAKDVVLVMRGGKVLYGDAAVVTALETSTTCDPVDVCGVSKKACVEREAKKSLSALTSADQSKYPLFVCGSAPSNEPSCQPSRTCANTSAACPVVASVNGSTVYDGMPTASDKDGDGIPNASDNCPDYFNPIRPQDGGKQADADKDNVGDICDPCPLNANTTTCKAYDPNDSDGDGKPNASDNCPDVANAGQEDGDSDGRGDVCDKCPTVSNPAPAACPGTIYQVKDGTLKEGDTVAIEGGIVTALAPKGFFMQVQASDPAFKGADYSGVYVFQGAVPTVKLGDIVDITVATATNYYNEWQLKNVTLTVVSSGNALPAPVVTNPTEAGTGGARAAKLEGVLVKVENVTVTNPDPTPDAADKTNVWEFEVGTTLRVHDFLFKVEPKPLKDDIYTSITGILHWDFNNSKIEPRDAADLVMAPGVARLADLQPTTAYVRAGISGPSIPPMKVSLVRAAATDTEIAITSSSTDLVIPNGKVTIPAGNTSAEVPFQGVNANASVTVTATLGTVTKTATVRVLGAAEVPATVTLSPATSSAAYNAKVEITATLDVPAPVGGTTITLSAAPAANGTLPATLVIPADSVSATFEFTAGATAGEVVITATMGTATSTAKVTVKAPAAGKLVINAVSIAGPGGGTDEYVVLYNGTNAEIDLNTHTIYYSSAGGSAPASKGSFTGLKIGAGKYLLMASATYADPVTKDATTSGGFGAAGGTIWLTSTATAPTAVTSANVVDVVAYGAVTSAFVEGTPAPLPNDTQEVGRKVAGVDTNNNAADFELRARAPKNLATP